MSEENEFINRQVIMSYSHFSHRKQQRQMAAFYSAINYGWCVFLELFIHTYKN